MSEQRLIGVHHCRAANLGDLVSPPWRYIDFPNLTPIDWRDERLPQLAQRAHAVIAGGGVMQGLRLQRHGAPVYGWGVGYTRAGHLGPHIVPNVDRWAMLGCRDVDRKRRWVPCASCMSPLFDETYPVERDIVFYESSQASGQHVRAFPKDWMPYMDNIVPGADLEGRFSQTVRFLASAETVVTNSYHGVYWSLLIGRKVIALPHGSKFYHFPLPLPMRHLEDWESGLREPNRSAGFLQKCRAANRRFADDVLVRLSIDGPNGHHTES